jgi:signal transduction histidine kinase
VHQRRDLTALAGASTSTPARPREDRGAREPEPQRDPDDLLPAPSAAPGPGGAAAALRWYLKGFEKRSGLAVHSRIAVDLGRLGEDLELAVFRIVQESLMNVQRHAEATEVRVTLQKQRGRVILEVADDGRGLDAARRSAKDAHRSRGSRAARRASEGGSGMGLIGSASGFASAR